MGEFTKTKDTMRYISSQDSYILKNKDINQYFINMTDKIFVARRYYSPERYEFIKFQEYLKKRYKDSCYHYSAYAIMAFLNNDFIVRGKIDVDERGFSNYEHGWIEFSFNGKEYVFDSLNASIVEKEMFYEHMKPIITYKASLQEILEIFLSTDNSNKIADNVFKIKSFDLIYNQYNKIDQSHLFLPLSESEIIFDTKNRSLIKKFTGYR